MEILKLLWKGTTQGSILLVKSGEMPPSGLGGDVVWSKLLIDTTEIPWSQKLALSLWLRWAKMNNSIVYIPFSAQDKYHDGELNISYQQIFWHY